MGRLIFLAGLLLALCLSFVMPCVGFAASSLPADTSLLERTCTECHDLEEIVEKEYYMADWKKIVERMLAYDSSEISQIDKLKVLKYVNENLAIDGPGGRNRRNAESKK
ncbi:MAG: hypothetical protein KAG92_05020 [Deltaproteobacteria bacterium]|nr:hypothetical protein [Deltaproteobacteria bacterium]